VADVDRARLALDEDVRPLLGRLLRDRGWDAVSVIDVGRAGLSDPEQLAWASGDARVLVTHNGADFARLAVQWLANSTAHAGICILKQGPVGGHLRALLGALTARPRAKDWTSQIVWAAVPRARGAGR